MTIRANEELSIEDCYARIGSGGVGRVVFTDDQGPLALPVNFGVIEGDILFRIQPTSAFAHDVDQVVGFEVDQIDPADQSGWSVLLRGHAGAVPLTVVPDLIRRIGDHFPKPWAEGVHNMWIRIAVTSVTGRHLTSLTSGLAV